MFYLLEDKKIYESSRSIGEINGKLFEAYHLFPDNKNIVCLGKIKKQSESVFDLVENGDCYLYQNKHMIKSEICLINDDVLLNIFKSRANETPETILAIYKPNSKGDYIKVWEKKDNEVK